MMEDYAAELQSTPLPDLKLGEISDENTALGIRILQRPHSLRCRNERAPMSVPRPPTLSETSPPAKRLRRPIDKLRF